MAFECLYKNGKNKEKIITFFVTKSSLSKELIFLLLKENFDSLNSYKNINLYDDKGILITEDADLYFLLEKKVLFFTKNNEEFNSSNLLRQYDIIKRLGEGGFGKVFLVKQKMNNKYYTIKFLNHNCQNIKDINFLYKEINFLILLKHPQIIELYSYFLTDENKIALIMEYLSGGTLKEYILRHKNKKLDEDEARNILHQILEIISYCHKMNIIHHDLKPENILFTDDTYKYIKIIDFGISSLINEKSNAGSLLYLPPEIITNKDMKSSPSVDIWSIGCIFAEMLLGKNLFKKEKINQTKKLISSGCYELPHYISNSARDLLKKMLNLNQRERISAQEALFHPFFNEINKGISNENSEIKENINNDNKGLNNESFNKTKSIIEIKIIDDENNKNLINESAEISKNSKKNNYLKKNNSKIEEKIRDLSILQSNKNNNNIINFNKISKKSNLISKNYNFQKRRFSTKAKLTIKLRDEHNNNFKKHEISSIMTNYHTDNNSIKKDISKNKCSKTNENENKKEKKIKFKNTINFPSRVNMARNKLLFNLKKVENYKKELSEFKTSRYSYGFPTKNSRNNNIIKHIPDLITRTNNISDDELISYWIKLSNKYDNEIPNFIKPIGFSKEQKQKIERFSKSLEKNHNKDNKNDMINKNKNQNWFNQKSNILITEFKNNNKIKKINLSRTIRVIKHRKNNRSGTLGKLVLPNLFINYSINQK